MYEFSYRVSSRLIKSKSCPQKLCKFSAPPGIIRHRSLLTTHPFQRGRLMQLLGLLKFIAINQTDLVLLLLLQRSLL